jgi:plastocyanin
VGGHSSVLIVILVFVVLFLLLYVSSAITIMRSPAAGVVTVIIPQGSSSPSSEHNNFEPAVIKVVIGENNTIRWINENVTSGSVVADNKSDPDFYNATHNDEDELKTLLNPGEIFEFTFTKPGEFGYHSVPHP